MDFKIQSGKLTLRSFNLNDVQEFFEMSHDDEVKKYVPYAYTNNLEEAEEFVDVYSKGDCKRDFYLIIEVENKIVGCIIAIEDLDGKTDISYIVSKNYRGKGIMTEAVKVFINWIKENPNLKLKTLKFCIEKGNFSSNRVIEKLEGRMGKQTENHNCYEINI